jgi:hypothetical protein
MRTLPSLEVQNDVLIQTQRCIATEMNTNER